MKKTGMILMLAILLPLSAFAARKKPAPPPDPTPPQAGTDWLNAPTPDGSPTLKETSDWLAQNFPAYAGIDISRDDPGDEATHWRFSDASIDGTCTFRWTETMWMGNGRKEVRDTTTVEHHSVPLGAVTEVSVRAPGEYDGENGSRWLRIHISTGNVSLLKLGTFAFFPIDQMPRAATGGLVPDVPEQMAPRIAKALQHSVDLCKGTYTPPTKAKQAF
jgi:hypothetical protein